MNIVNGTNIIDVIILLETRQGGVFLSERTILALQYYLRGYLFGVGGNIDYQSYKLFQQFNHYFLEKCNITDHLSKDINYEQVLYTSRKVKGEQAFDAFFEIFNAFLVEENYPNNNLYK